MRKEDEPEALAGGTAEPTRDHSGPGTTANPPPKVS